jgi:hypothetical protein
MTSAQIEADTGRVASSLLGDVAGLLSVPVPAVAVASAVTTGLTPSPSPSPSAVNMTTFVNYTSYLNGTNGTAVRRGLQAQQAQAQQLVCTTSLVSTVTTVVAVRVTLTVTEAQRLSAQFAGGASSVPPAAFVTTSAALRTCVGWPYNASVALPTGFSLDIASAAPGPKLDNAGTTPETIAVFTAVPLGALLAACCSCCLWALLGWRRRRREQEERKASLTPVVVGSASGLSVREVLGAQEAGQVLLVLPPAEAGAAGAAAGSGSPVQAAAKPPSLPNSRSPD